MYCKRLVRILARCCQSERSVFGFFFLFCLQILAYASVPTEGDATCAGQDAKPVSATKIGPLQMLRVRKEGRR